MTLEEFGQELRTARLERNVSLSDISAETRINQRFLEAVEAGKFSVLPQTYVRAFLREYASAVGLTAESVLARYDELRGEPPPVRREPAAPTVRPDPSSGPPPTQSLPYLRPLIFGSIVVLGGALAYVILKPSEAPPPSTTPAEIPFDRVIRETEAALPADTQRVIAYAPTPVTVAPPPAKTDSLVLEMSTTDSVWLSLVIDHARTEEYLFPPNRRRTWRAAERFTLTMGNAGGATFRLNGKDLGMLGRRGAVLRNSVLTADLLR